MQAKILALAAVLGLALPLAAACDTYSQDATSDDAAAVGPVASAAAIPDAPPPDSVSDAADTPHPAAEPDRGQTPVRAAAQASEPSPAPPPETPPEPPTDVEPLIVIGPRDGETLGEYRARADRLFHRLDADGDERLGREEIISRVSPLSLRNALERADADVDDHVSRQEFNDLATRAYQRLDADGNGVITDAEFEAGDPLGVD